MKTYSRLALPGFILVGALVLFGSVAGAAYAQGLPSTQHADNDPTAKASRRGDSGGALEPYLITLLLPFGGIVMAASGLLMDRRLRTAGHG